MSEIKLATKSMLVFIILVLLTGLFTGCSRQSVLTSVMATPIPTYTKLDQVIEQLHKLCFAAVSEEEPNKPGYRTAQDADNVVDIWLHSSGNQLLDATMTIQPLGDWMGYYSRVGGCIQAVTEPANAVGLAKWYSEQDNLNFAQTEMNGVQATMRGREQEVRTLIITYATSEVSAAQSQPAAVEEQKTCGLGVVSGLGAGRLNVRATPGLNGEVVAKALEGTRIQITCDAQQTVDKITWIKVIIIETNASGWVSKQYITVQ